MLTRAVVDNNVPLSFLSGAGPTIRRLMDLWQDEHFVWLTSRPIVDELALSVERLRSSRQFHEDSNRLLVRLWRAAEWTAGVPIANGACRDPDDDKFLSCALEGRADYLVSGDQHLLAMKSFHGTRILSPRDFVALLDAELTP